MGQKVNATVFRLGLKNFEWNSKYNESNVEESSLLLIKNLHIRDYIDRVFKLYGLIINTCKIEYSKEKIIVYISFYKLKWSNKKNQNINNIELITDLIKKNLLISLNLYNNNSIIIKLNNLNKKFEVSVLKSKKKIIEHQKLLKKFRGFNRDKFIKEFIKIAFITVFVEKRSAKLLAEFLALYIYKNKKRHNYILFFFKKIVNTLIQSKTSLIKGVKVSLSGRFNGVLKAKQKNFKIGSVPSQSLKYQIDYFEKTVFTSNGTFGIKIWVC